MASKLFSILVIFLLLSVIFTKYATAVPTDSDDGDHSSNNSPAGDKKDDSTEKGHSKWKKFADPKSYAAAARRQ